MSTARHVKLALHLAAPRRAVARAAVHASTRQYTATHLMKNNTPKLLALSFCQRSMLMSWARRGFMQTSCVRGGEEEEGSDWSLNAAATYDWSLPTAGGAHQKLPSSKGSRAASKEKSSWSLPAAVVYGAHSELKQDVPPLKSSHSSATSEEKSGWSLPAAVVYSAHPELQRGASPLRSSHWNEVSDEGSDWSLPAVEYGAHSELKQNTPPLKSSRPSAVSEEESDRSIRAASAGVHRKLQHNVSPSNISRSSTVSMAPKPVPSSISTLFSEKKDTEPAPDIPTVPKVVGWPVPWLVENEFENYLKPLLKIGWGIRFYKGLHYPEELRRPRLIAQLNSEYSFSNYDNAVDFFKEIVKLISAEHVQHHPTILLTNLRRPSIKISTQTDSAIRPLWPSVDSAIFPMEIASSENGELPKTLRKIPGITRKDVRLAALIEEVYTRYVKEGLTAGKRGKAEENKDQDLATWDAYTKLIQGPTVGLGQTRPAQQRSASTAGVQQRPECKFCRGPHTLRTCPQLHTRTPCPVCGGAHRRLDCRVPVTPGILTMLQNQKEVAQSNSKLWQLPTPAKTE